MVSTLLNNKTGDHMTREDLRYIPHNFAELANADIINQHKALITANNYTQAVNLLDSNPQVEGMTAGLFNNIEQKILFVLQQLEGKEVVRNLLYQQTEPTDAEFEGKVIWGQEY